MARRSDEGGKYSKEKVSRLAKFLYLRMIL